MPPHAHRFVYLTVGDFWHQSAHNSAWHLIFYTLWHKFRQGANQCSFHIFKPGMKSLTPVTRSLGSRVNRSGAPLKQPWVMSSSKHMQRQQPMGFLYQGGELHLYGQSILYGHITICCWCLANIPKDSLSKFVLPCAFFQYWLCGAGIINIYFKPCLLHTSGKRSCQK